MIETRCIIDFISNVNEWERKRHGRCRNFKHKPKSFYGIQMKSSNFRNVGFGFTRPLNLSFRPFTNFWLTESGNNWRKNVKRMEHFQYEIVLNQSGPRTKVTFIDSLIENILFQFAKSKLILVEQPVEFDIFSTTASSEYELKFICQIFKLTLAHCLHQRGNVWN